MNTKNPLFIVFFILLWSCGQKRGQLPLMIELSSNWEFMEVGTESWYPATVPGLVHLDLFNNDIIGDPYREDNEIKQRWIENTNWIYKTSFNVEQLQMENNVVKLLFEGIDTYAEVFLNDTLILSTDNMFREWKKDVKQFLRPGKNELSVRLLSPILLNRDRVKQYPHNLPSGNESSEIDIKVSPFTRKAAYHFGWDWGPRFVSCGIWKSVKLLFYDKAHLVRSSCSTKSLDENGADMSTNIEIEVFQTGEYDLIVDGINHSFELKNGNHSLSIPFELEDPILWWCNGEGKPHLYQQEVLLKKDGLLVDSTSHTFGVRTIELVNKPDSIGTTFYFKLNGKPIFMQGANYIPQDLFLPRVKNEQYINLLSLAKKANMNMLRVWGGGIYESDYFYKLCDKYGILIWQDFMFANSLYPSDSSFIDNVKIEIKENVNRIKGHPCLALWCGNNEIEVAWQNWGWQDQFGYSTEDSIKLWKDYLYLFHDIIPEIVQKNDPYTDYCPTSPQSNWGTRENFNHGSMHYWGVWHGREPFESFNLNVGRFMAEYGFQSFPSLSTLKTAMHDSSLYLNSIAMNQRQKSYIGNGLIEHHILQYFDASTDFKDFIKKSQLTQAVGLQKAIRVHKNSQPQCMGTLLWQLNDCWPGPSWSIIDYYGNPKEAYETVKLEYSIR